VLALDTRLRLLREALVAIGGLNGVGVEPRDVFAPVVRERAASVIVIHNHPSGVPNASPEDLALAVRLWRAAGILGVKLLDFVVVAREGCTSFGDLGLLLEDDDHVAHRIVRHRRYRPRR
jgi:DNA repair protein RadC